MRKFIFVALSLIILTGCTPSMFRNLNMRPVSSVKMQRSTLMPAFDKLEKPLFFSAQIDHKENSISGILALSKDSASLSYRMIMMTAFGVPIFDFSISRDKFVVNQCMSQLNKKPVLDILQKDFNSILMLNLPEQFSGVLYMSSGNTTRTGYNLKIDDGEVSYVIYPRENSFVRMVQYGCCLKKMNAVFDEETITIEHPNLNLTIILKKMPK